MHRKRRAWALAGKILTGTFIVLVLALVVWKGRSIDWPQVGRALRSYEAGTLALAALLAATSGLVYTCYDLIGRAHLRHGVPPLRVMAIAYVSYVFNLNLGALVGGFAFRYRLYAGAGLKPGVTTQILGLSLATNWLGVCGLAGLVFTLGLLPIPPELRVGAGVLRVLGAVLLAAPVAYLVLCGCWRRRQWRVRGRVVRLPSMGLALLQLMVGTLNWLIMALILFVLMRQQPEFPAVVGTLMISAVAGVITHVPAGIGVLEFVFLTCLEGAMQQPALLAALIAYRAVYYLGPLLVGVALYAALELRVRHAPRPAIA